MGLLPGRLNFKMNPIRDLNWDEKKGRIEEKSILKSLTNRPANQHVVITGRAASESLIEVADTVSEILDIKHAFRANIKAQKGLDL